MTIRFRVTSEPFFHMGDGEPDKPLADSFAVLLGFRRMIAVGEEFETDLGISEGNQQFRDETNSLRCLAPECITVLEN